INILKRLATRYELNSVMTGGGEPMLHAKTVCQIHEAAREMGVSHLQLITNGYFTQNFRRFESMIIDEVAAMVVKSGVNDILISVDGFHQEYIPMGPVLEFAEALLRHNAPRVRAHPAWLINAGHVHTYNTETIHLLTRMERIGIKSSKGNSVIIEGNAAKHFDDLKQYSLSASPHVPNPFRTIKSISIEPDGDVHTYRLIGNIYQDDILDILDNHPE
ncbi:MAG: hypothetical protein FWB71_02090, partial [Defluviitaleaceae bacterium]|nr:hypothetical protein [Defluviitaleaceae bacterium]